MKDATARAEEYRSKAEEIRAVADAMHITNVRAILLGIAQDYLEMADVLEHDLRHYGTAISQPGPVAGRTAPAN